MLVSMLPEGPTMNFKLTNLKTSDEIKVNFNLFSKALF